MKKRALYKKTSRRMVVTKPSTPGNTYYSLFGNALSNNFSYKEFKKSAQLLKEVSNK